MIARVISTSSEMDAAVAFMLGRMLKANTAPAMALFLALRQSRVQHEVLSAVAKSVLDAPDQELFAALMSLRSGCDRERDALAHGRFGVAPKITEGIVWVDSLDYLQFEVRVEAGEELTPAQDWLRERMFVYDLSDLSRLIRDATQTYNSIRSFAGYIYSTDTAWRALRYPQLCTEPHVQQSLHLVREGARKKKEAPPKSPP
jgi:hypothetical protein